MGLSVTSIIISLAAIIQFFFECQIPDGYLDPKRATSFFPYPAALALYLAPVLIFLTAFLWQRAKFARWEYGLLILSIVSGFVALLLSKAEGGIGAYLLAVAIFGLFSKHRLKFLAAGLIVLIIVLAIPHTRNRTVQVFTFQDTSGEVRLALWEGSWNLIKDRPVLGAGLASFPEVYEKYKLDRHVELPLYPHNVFLNFWVEMGLLGLLSFLGLLGWFFWRCWGVLRYARTMWQKSVIAASFLAMIVILIYGLVDAPYFKNDLACQFFLFVGLIALVEKKRKA